MDDACNGPRGFEVLIATILARFASRSGPEIDDEIRQGLAEIARFVGIDYAFVIQATADFSCWTATHDWCGEGIPSLLACYQNVPMGTLGWIENALLRGEIVVCHSLDEIPSSAVAVRRHWEALGFQSTLHLPLRGRGGLTRGCIGLSSLSRPVRWAPVDVQRMQLVAEAVANALERKHAEENLRESESRFRTTFEQAPVGILSVALNGKVLRVNQRFCEMLGCASEELLDKHFSDFTHRDDCQASANLYRKVLAERTSSQSLEKRYLRHDGRVVWGNVTVSLLTDLAGQPQTFLAAIEDITARKQAEETFDAVPDIIFVLDNQHRIVRMNRAGLERLGCTREGLIGRYCHEVLHGSPSPRKGCWHTQLLADGKEQRFESHDPCLGGHFLVSITPLRSASGDVVGSVHVARDITERRRAEVELQRAHEELQQRRALAVAASLDGVWEWDIASDAVQYSPRFLELLGHRPDEVPCTLALVREALHPDDAPAMWDAVERHLKHDDRYDVECRLRTREGLYRWFRTRGQAQRNAAGQAVWMAGSLQEIHDRKAAETELREALQEVRRLTHRLQAENIYLQEEIASAQGFDEIVGESELLRSTLAKVEHVADTDASVLLLGETGTGKELLARAIHHRSRRKDHPLVKVNLAALSASLIESELFGHVKGAFTGAVSDKVGRFELADGGTLFLDEIGDLAPELQAKLLRVLQEGEFERIGSATTTRADVRVVAATNRDLLGAMREDRFRPDLYYRLAVFPIEVPPLRFRRDDIPRLVWHFIAKKQLRLGKSIRSIPQPTMAALVQYDWPGNVRELENVIERAMILTPDSNLVLAGPLIASERSPCKEPVSRGRVDRNQLIAVLEDCGWKIKGQGNAADRLGIKPSTLRYRMKTTGIQRPTTVKPR